MAKARHLELISCNVNLMELVIRDIYVHGVFIYFF